MAAEKLDQPESDHCHTGRGGDRSNVIIRNQDFEHDDRRAQVWPATKGIKCLTFTFLRLSVKIHRSGTP
jgi:hypothetical protein